MKTVGMKKFHFPLQNHYEIWFGMCLIAIISDSRMQPYYMSSAMLVKIKYSQFGNKCHVIGEHRPWNRNTQFDANCTSYGQRTN